MKKRSSVEEAVSARKWAVFIAVIAALMVGSAGVAVFPDIAQLAAPFVCSGGNLITATSSSSLGQGRNGSRTQVSVSCVDASGARSEVAAILIMLVIMAELSVPFAGIGWWICSQVWPVREPEADDD